MVKTNEQAIATQTIEQAPPSVGYSNAFYRGDIELVKCSNNPEKPEYKFVDKRNPKIYPDVRLPGDAHLRLGTVRARVRHYTGILPFPHIKAEEWTEIIAKKLDEGATRTEFSPDTSLEADILAALNAWLDQRGEGTHFLDLTTGGASIVKQEDGDDWHYFYPKARSLKGYIDSYVGQKVDKGELWNALKRVGVKYKKQKISGTRQNVHCWGVPKRELEAAVGIEQEHEELIREVMSQEF